MNYLYENDLFGVCTVTLTDPVLNEPTLMYGVFNRQTGVREAEARRQFTAVALADGFEDQHKHPEKYVEQFGDEAPAIPGGGVH